MFANYFIRRDVITVLELYKCSYGEQEEEEVDEKSKSHNSNVLFYSILFCAFFHRSCTLSSVRILWTTRMCRCIHELDHQRMDISSSLTTAPDALLLAGKRVVCWYFTLNTVIILQPLCHHLASVALYIWGQFKTFYGPKYSARINWNVVEG